MHVRAALEAAHNHALEATPMSEVEIPPVGAPEALEGNEPFDEARAKDKIAKSNREAQQLRERLRALEPLALRAQELEDAQKSEAQRATEALSAAERRALDAESKLLRHEVAQEKGLTPAQAKRLVGATREELLADADDFIASLPTPAPTTGQRTPVEALRPGALPNVPPPTLADQITAAEKAKDWKLAMSLKSQQVVALTESQK